MQHQKGTGIYAYSILSPFTSHSILSPFTTPSLFDKTNNYTKPETYARARRGTHRSACTYVYTHDYEQSHTCTHTHTPDTSKSSAKVVTKKYANAQQNPPTVVNEHPKCPPKYSQKLKMHAKTTWILNKATFF